MAGPFTPQDTVIGPILSQIASLVHAQIPSIGKVWTTMPDRSPSDNQVVLLVRSAHVESPEGFGRIVTRYTIGLLHVFRRAEQATTVTRAYSYLNPWLLFLSAWQNQSLGGLARTMCPTDVKVIQMVDSGQPVIALSIDFDVLTEQNVVTS